MKAVDVKGVQVKVEQIPELVKQQLRTGLLWADRMDVDNASGLYRAIRALQGSPLRPTFIEAALGLVTDQDVGTRTGALAVIRNFGKEVDAAPRLMQAWRAHPELYQGVGIDRPESDLETLLISALAASARPEDRAVIEVLRDFALDPHRTDTVIAGLARVDPDWMVTHVLDWVGTDGQRIVALLGKVDDSKLQQAVKALKIKPPEVRSGAAYVIGQAVADRDEAASLIRLLQ